MLLRALFARLGCGALVLTSALPAFAAAPGTAPTIADAVFATQVLRYLPGYGAGCVPTHANFVDPTVALGVADYSGGAAGTGAVSLGKGGLLELVFWPPIANSGDARNDLRILEVGGFDEALYVALRPAPPHTHADMLALGLRDANGDGFYEIKRIGGGSAYVDLDRYFDIVVPTYGVLFDAIQLIDDAQDHAACTSTPGADIDYVEGMHPFVSVEPITWTRVKSLYAR
jgi:hypothetical protein